MVQLLLICNSPQDATIRPNPRPLSLDPAQWVLPIRICHVLGLFGARIPIRIVYLDRYLGDVFSDPIFRPGVAAPSYYDWVYWGSAWSH